MHGASASASVSQVSPSCSTPSPQLAEQSSSLSLLHISGQQPSSLLQSCCSSAQYDLQLLSFSMRGTQSTSGGHSFGQAPGMPSGMAMSQRSSSATSPSPQRCAGIPTRPPPAVPALPPVPPPAEPLIPPLPPRLL